MSQDITPYEQGKQLFENLKRFDDKGEYWLASEICDPLGYTWRGFQAVIERAIAALVANGEDPTDHIELRKTPSVTVRGMTDYRLSRYGAYTAVQGGEPTKAEIAAGWAYFRIQTRKSEIMESELDADLRQIVQMSVAIQQTRDEQRRLAAIQEEQNSILRRHAARLDSIESHSGWQTSLAFAKTYNLPDTSEPFCNKLSRKAGKIARANDIEPNKVPHEKWGTVNSYPIWIWEQAFAELN